MTDFGLSDDILAKIKNVLARYPKVLSAGIYGSRGRGDYKNYSDIDIAIHGPDLTSNDFSNLRFDIEMLPIIFKMDVAHVEKISNQELLEKIQRDEKQFYQPAGMGR
jgi:predicted nucleotidyltransferase